MTVDELALRLDSDC